MRTIFRVGDRVRLIDKIVDNAQLTEGMTGTVLCEDEASVGVCWDYPFDTGHSLGGKCGFNRGWWVIKESVKLVSDDDDKELEAPDLTNDDFISFFCGANE